MFDQKACMLLVMHWPHLSYNARLRLIQKAKEEVDIGSRQARALKCMETNANHVSDSIPTVIALAMEDLL